MFQDNKAGSSKTEKETELEKNTVEVMDWLEAVCGRYPEVLLILSDDYEWRKQRRQNETGTQKYDSHHKAVC
jgi:hypothetical protein